MKGNAVGKDKEFMPEIVLSDQVKKQMEENPDLAEDMREVSALFRQAMQLVHDGKYETFPDAMEALTGRRPVAVGDGDPELSDATAYIDTVSVDDDDEDKEKLN